MKHTRIRNCQVGLHGAGPNPMAKFMVWLPTRGTEYGWIAACEKCKMILAADAARDGERLITQRFIPPKFPGAEKVYEQEATDAS